MGTDNTQFRRRFRVWRRKYSERSSTFSLRFTAISGSISVGQDLKSEYSSRATRGRQNKEFSSNIQAEARESRGSRVFGTLKSFVFASRGRDFLLLRLFLLTGHSMAVWFSSSVDPQFFPSTLAFILWVSHSPIVLI